MPKYRLINCDFINAGSFGKNCNKAKLLYLSFITHADDCGFVDNAEQLIEQLDLDDLRQGNTDTLTLLRNDYTSALNDLLDRNYLYLFTDNHGNAIYLIRHWFIHNKYSSRLNTNYKKFLSLVELVNGEYQIKTHTKGKEVKERKLKEIKGNNQNIILKDKSSISNSDTNNYKSRDIDSANNYISHAREENDDTDSSNEDKEWNDLMEQLAN